MRMLTTTFLGLALLLALSTAVLADEQADCKALIEKAVKARGGLDKLAKLTCSTSKAKGTVHIMGMDLAYTSEHTIQHPDKSKAQIDFEVMGTAVKFVVVFDGKEGWRKVNDMLQDMTEEQVAEQKEGAYVNTITNLVALLKDQGFKFNSLGESKIEGKPAVGVRVASKDHRDVSFWFDKDSGHLVKSSSRIKEVDQNMEFDQETLYGDYKEVDGVKQPMKLTIKRDGNPFVESEITEIKLSESLPASTFSKP